MVPGVRIPGGSVIDGKPAMVATESQTATPLTSTTQVQRGEFSTVLPLGIRSEEWKPLRLRCLGGHAITCGESTKLDRIDL